MAWERLAHVALSGANATIDTGTITAKKNLRVICYVTGKSQSSSATIQFNSDTGSNYPRRFSIDGGADNTETGGSIITHNTQDANPTYFEAQITNISDKEKLYTGHAINQGSSGSGNAPSRCEAVNKWTNTSAQITSIQVNASGGTFGSGSYLTVLGAKEAATADVITVDSLAAKKHLMIQTKILTTNGNTKPSIRFNNDSGNNYATRDSDGGGTDATETTVAEIRLSQDSHGGTAGVFASNINVINEASKEKLIIADTVRANATGAGTAPDRYEIVSKWANTSNAITRVDIINEGTGDFAEGSEVTVYGTD